MPIYGYECRSCEHTFDTLQKISDEPLVDCPECGAPELRKQLSAPKFRLKGSGWYETDFKTGNKRNVLDDSDSKPSEAKDDTKKEPKSESKDSKPKSTEASA